MNAYTMFKVKVGFAFLARMGKTPGKMFFYPGVLNCLQLTITVTACSILFGSIQLI